MSQNGYGFGHALRAVVPGATCDGSKATRSRQQQRDALWTSLRAVVPGATCDGSGHALRAVVPGASYDGSEGSRESLTMALGASYDGSEGARESSQQLCGSTLSGSRELRTMALRDPGRRQGASYDGMLSPGSSVPAALRQSTVAPRAVYLCRTLFLPLVEPYSVSLLGNYPSKEP